MTVYAIFKDGDRCPTPLKSKISEGGEEKTVDVGKVLNVQQLGAGGMSRFEYTCESPGTRGLIRYKLNYYYTKGSWSIERTV